MGVNQTTERKNLYLRKDTCRKTGMDSFVQFVNFKYDEKEAF